jgi:hypothetical protein
MGVSGQHQAPATIYPRGKDPQYPFDRRLGGPNLDSENTYLLKPSSSSAMLHIVAAVDTINPTVTFQRA